jgi:Flp pilus assembly pilin Flp
MKKSKGQTVAEYALLLCAVALFASTAFYAFGCNVHLSINRVNSALASAGH